MKRTWLIGLFSLFIFLGCRAVTQEFGMTTAEPVAWVDSGTAKGQLPSKHMAAPDRQSEPNRGGNTGASSSQIRLVDFKQDVETASDGVQIQETQKLPSSEEDVSPQTDLTLADLEEMALANNPALAWAIAQIDAARGRWVQVGLSPNPKFGYQAQEIGNSGQAGQHGVFLSQQIVTNDKLYLNRAVADSRIDSRQQQRAAQQQRVINDVRLRFYDALFAQRSVDLTNELVNIGERAVEVAEQLFRGQEVGKSDVLQTRVEFNTARLRAISAQADLAGAWRRLTSVVGVPDLPPAPLAGDLKQDMKQLSWEESLGRLQAESPERAVARAEIERAEWALERAYAGSVPNFVVQANLAYDDSTSNTFAGFQFSIPWMVHDRNQGNIRRAQAELVAARREEDRLRLALRDRLAAAFTRYDSARGQVDIYDQDILPGARSLLDLVNRGRAAGEFDYLRMITAQRSYSQAALGRLEALQELRARYVAIEGFLLTGGLEKNQSG